MVSTRGTRSLGLVLAAALLCGGGVANADKAKSKKAATAEKQKPAAKAKAPKAKPAPVVQDTDVPAPPPVVQRKVDPFEAALMQAMATTDSPATKHKAKPSSAAKARAAKRARKSGGLRGLTKFTRSSRKARLGNRRGKQVPTTDTVVRMDVQPLAQREVSAVIKKNTRKVHYCHERLANRGIAANGAVSVTFVIEPRGHVSNVKVVAGGAGAKELQRCMKKRILTWKFPAADAPTTVEYPFLFAVAGSTTAN